MARKHHHTEHPDPGSPLVVNIARLGRRPGSMFAMHETVASPARIGLEMIGIAPGAPLDLDLRIESVSEGVLVSGTLSAPIAGECSRCLTPFTERIDVDLTELFAYPDSLTEATTDELPFSPVCRTDCPGLCPTCGVALATAEPDHHHDDIDPRWAKLATMLGSDIDGAGNE
jgi:uncharacterized protein